MNKEERLKLIREQIEINKKNALEEIEKAYKRDKSIFDTIKETDMILAFFPCVRFEDQIQLHFRGCATQMKKMDK